MLRKFSDGSGFTHVPPGLALDVVSWTFASRGEVAPLLEAPLEVAPLAPLLPEALLPDAPPVDAPLPELTPLLLALPVPLLLLLPPQAARKAAAKAALLDATRVLRREMRRARVLCQ